MRVGYNRNDSLIYPTGFGIGYSYQNGYMSQVSRLDNGASIWQAPTYNAREQLTQYKHGNNLITSRTYDTYGLPSTITTGSVQNWAYQVNAATGNFTYRKDVKHNLQENFAYDALDRLDSITMSGRAPMVISYASNGNINSKTDIGTYSYNGSGPFNVASVTNPNSVIDTARQDITYSSFDKVNTIKQNIYQMTYTYGYGKERCKAVYKQSLAVTKTKYYVLGNYEKELNGNGGNIRDLHYISTPAGITAVYDKVNNHMYYLLADVQGSLNVVTDESGAIVQELGYDAYGRRRNATDWTYNNMPSSYTFERGYTMHEHMDWFGGLINMNGRMYDSKIGRFLSADLFVQNSTSTQSYNRYSYCLNNPLKYSDPSGMKWITFKDGEVDNINQIFDMSRQFGEEAMADNDLRSLFTNRNGGYDGHWAHPPTSMYFGVGNGGPRGDQIDYAGMANISHGYTNINDLLNDAWNATTNNGVSSSQYDNGVLMFRSSATYSQFANYLDQHNIINLNNQIDGEDSPSMADLGDPPGTQKRDALNIQRSPNYNIYSDAGSNYNPHVKATDIPEIVNQFMNSRILEKAGYVMTFYNIGNNLANRDYTGALLDAGECAGGPTVIAAKVFVSIYDTPYVQGGIAGYYHENMAYFANRYVQYENELDLSLAAYWQGRYLNAVSNYKQLTNQ